MIAAQRTRSLRDGSPTSSEQIGLEEALKKAQDALDKLAKLVEER